MANITFDTRKMKRRDPARQIFKITVSPLKWGLSKARYKIERLELLGITRTIKFKFFQRFVHQFHHKPCLFRRSETLV